MPIAFFSSPPYELKSQCVPATLRVPVFASSSTMHCGALVVQTPYTGLVVTSCSCMFYRCVPCIPSTAVCAHGGQYIHLANLKCFSPGPCTASLETRQHSRV